MSTIAGWGSDRASWEKATCAQVFGIVSVCGRERVCARARARRQRRREDNEDDDDEEGDEGEEENVLQSLSLLAHSSPSSYRYEAAQ